MSFIRKPSMIAAAISLAATFVLPAAGQDVPKLTVYTYESFIPEWGPGPKVEQAFEEDCGCDLEFVPAADGVALLNRLRLEGERTEADIVLGLDTNLIADAKATGLLAPHGLDMGDRLAVPGGFNDDTFVPYDYGFFAVVYDTETITEPPTSMADFLAADPAMKIAVQDPRTSTPGLGLLLWMRSIYGDDTEAALAALGERTLTVTPGWSEAYALFTSGEVPMVLSYTTSPAYHMLAEETDRYQAMAFSEGHYMQIEVAARTAKAADNPLAAQFLDFLTGPQVQAIIPTTNWMLPVAETAEPIDPVFGRLVEVDTPLLFDSETVAANRSAWVNQWLDVMSR